MILVDTSVWADHFRRTDPQMVGLLAEGQVVIHAFVTGELALGNLRPWESTVAMLRALPRAKIASEGELLALIAGQRLSGTGIGFVDAHLLAACRLTPGLRLWSRDKRLATHADALEIGWPAT